MAKQIIAALLVLFAVSACQAGRLQTPSVSETTAKKSAPDFEPPNFYNGKEGPEFRIETSGESYDVRTYLPATWATTKVTDTKLDKAFKEGTSRLENYRKGGNKNGTKYDATVPTFVILTPAPTGRAFETDFVVHTFVPKDLQDTAPEPDEDEVELRQYPEQQAYVKTFGGYAFEDAVLEQTFDFIEELKQAGVATEDATIGFAQYDGPLKLINRHNEIFVIPGAAPSVSGCHMSHHNKLHHKSHHHESSAVTVSEDDTWESPSWCYKKDCPRFVVKETAADGAELRLYRPSKWLEVNYTDVSWEKATEEGAKELKSYRDGNNNMKKEVGETSPSSSSILYIAEGPQPAIKSTFQVQSYLPYELQEQEAPKPSSEIVKIVEFPSELVWVKVFGGFAKEADIVREAFQFREELQKAEKDIIPDYFGFGGFDPIITLLNRHNEIYFFVKGAAPSTKMSWSEQQVSQMQKLRQHAAFP